VCRDGLARAAEWFGTDLPAGLLDSLVPARGGETAHTYLTAGLVRREYMNFRALAGPGPKLRLLREVAFPPASYMRARYAGARPDWLPLHYLRRGVGGLAGRLWHSAWGRAGRERGRGRG
jgi:hypothetical protein